MQARTLRNISSGKEYNHLFPLPTKKDISIKKEAGVSDTVQLIQRTVPQTLWHTGKLAKVLNGKTLQQTCKNIWDFVYTHIQYKKDKDGVEQVRSPRRTWWERETGVDCDCYTEFISSILSNLGIAHKLRIAMYDPLRGWQHIYPVVPVNGRTDQELGSRDEYIVIDCVKDEFDAEQPFLKIKDYVMKLEFLDGTDDGEDEDFEYVEAEEVYGMPPGVDVRDLSDANEMGSWFSDTVKKVGKTVKKGIDQAGKTVQKVVKDAGQKAGQVIHDVNRYANAATIMIRNGFLLAMKINLMNVAGRLRFAYLTDAQAEAIGFNKGLLENLRQVMHKAETIYFQAGGIKENLKKVILQGEGNKDHKVPLNGIGFGEIGEVYADQMEYDIMHSNITGLGDLGEPVTASILASAAAIVAAISEILKSLGKSKDTANDAKSKAAKKLLADDTKGAAMPGSEAKSSDSDTSNFDESDNSKSQDNANQNNDGPPSQGSENSGQDSGDQNGSSDPGNGGNPEPSNNSVQKTDKSVALQKQRTKALTSNEPAPPSTKKGIVEWAKANPGKIVLIGSGVAFGGYMLYEHLHDKPHHLSGLPHQKPKKKSNHPKSKKGKAPSKGTTKIQCKKFSK